MEMPHTPDSGITPSESLILLEGFIKSVKRSLKSFIKNGKRSLKKKLNKLKNEYASFTGTDAHIHARPF